MPQSITTACEISNIVKIRHREIISRTFVYRVGSSCRAATVGNFSLAQQLQNYELHTPGRTQSFLTRCAHPQATTIRSACRQISSIFSVFEWQTVTVALHDKSKADIGAPTIFDLCQNQTKVKSSNRIEQLISNAQTFETAVDDDCFNKAFI